MTSVAPQVDRPARVGRPVWESAYASALVVVDAVVVTCAALLAVSLRSADEDVLLEGARSIGYTEVALGFAPVWVLMLAASRSYEARFLGSGSDEYKRVVNATVRFAALLSVSVFLFGVQLSRAFVAGALPIGLLLLLLGRYVSRKVLSVVRRRGIAQHRAVVVGSREEVTGLAGRIIRERYSGMQVVAACLPDYDQDALVVEGENLPLLGPPRGLAARLAEVDADTVAVAGTSALSSRELRELAWQLEGTGVDLAVSPALTDVAGPRIHVRPVAGLPLLHVEAPTFTGAKRLVKGLIDITAASALLLLLAPVFALIALAIKRDDNGPVFYRQERVGLGGRPFRIWKFRTMRVGADQELTALQALNEQAGPLFKIRKDPRISRVGARLRRHSIDELPQLLNVLSGSMSLVGPRPPLRSEVDEYADHVHRRLLVKPGMTGLWQVSGRADLEWDEAVRLDLYYVENWSVAMDVLILWKTLAEVVRGRGAY
jgi:exopolysaccharide biosynthesis polyprenyl glycosylphosphotransferase